MANPSPTPVTRRALVVVGLLAVGAVLAVWGSREPTVVAGALRLSLPERVGDWVGQEIQFCQNVVCGRSYRAAELPAEGTNCPACGAALDAWSVAERAVLPPDTRVLRRQYTNSRGEALQVSVVISGAEQKSIHRPQQCLPAQGLVIERARSYAAPTAPERGRELTGLTLRRAGAGAAADGWFYAYWFTDGAHATASHWGRLGWMSWDRVVVGTARPWAYIGLFTTQRPGSDAHLRRVRDFLAHWDPTGAQ